MNKISSYCLALSLFFSPMACQVNEEQISDDQRIIDDIKAVFPITKSYDFKIEQKYGDDPVFTYVLVSELPDTLVVLNVETRFFEFPDVTERTFILYSFKKVYNENGEKWYLNLNHKGDTLFWYTKNIDSINFRRGKYLYQFHYQKISTSQMDYFLEYADSLSRIEGNDLLPLPEKEKD
jgi:hypothetical protein